MSQRDLVAELRAARVTAPSEVRERVRLVAAQAPTPTRRFTWRRALVVAVPVAAAVAASIVFTRPASNQSATETTILQARVQHGSAGAALRSAPADAHAYAIPASKQRVQVIGTSLSLRTKDISGGVKRAVAITTSLSGYAASVHADLDSADLTLKVPRVHVQAAVARLSKLGTITGERLDIQDKQAGLNATDRTIARLRSELAKETDAAKRAALTARIERLQRAEAQTRRNAHFATIRLHLAVPAAAAKHGHGPLHGVGVALRWLGIGAVYALAVGAPVAIILALVWLAVRLVRRRREDALLSSR